MRSILRPRPRPPARAGRIARLVLPCAAVLAAAAATAVAPPLAAQAPAADARPASLFDAFARASQAIGRGDHAAVRRALGTALEFAPAHGTVLFHLARAEAMEGDAAAALGTLERLARQGAARDVAADTAFSALARGADSARFRAVAARIAAAGAPLVRSDTAFVLDDPAFVPEGVAHDAARGALLVGSLGGRGIVRIDRGGRATPWVAPGADGADQVLGMRVDAARGRLWVAALDVDTAAPRFRRGPGGWAWLLAYDLATGRLVARHAAPDSARPHLLNDVALAPGGDVYVTDSEGGALWRLRAGAASGARLERVHGDARDFTYPNGVAVSPDGRRLWVSHVEGLSTVALAGAMVGRVERVAPPGDGTFAGGADGLYACGDGLLAVQGLLDFQQVARYELSPDGRRVTSVRALERRHPAHDAATTGAIAGDAFLYVANAQLRRLAPDGTVSTANATPTVVLRLPLGGACGVAR